MRRKLCIVLLLSVLSLEAANKIVGAGLVPARSGINQRGQVQALPLQNSSSPEFFVASLRPDGVARTQSRRRRRHRQRRRLIRSTGVLSIKGTSSEETEVTAPKGAPPSEPMVGSSPQSAPPARKAAPPIDVSRPGAPKPNTAPGIKPPTVQIKPPTR